MNWEKTAHYLRCGISGLWLGFQAFLLVSPQTPMVQCPIHLAFALSLIFFWYPHKSERLGPMISRGIDLALQTGLVIALFYYWRMGERLTGRMEAVDPIYWYDIAAGLILVAAVLEGVRRVIGWSLLSVLLVFLAFGFAGMLFPFWLQWNWVPEMFKFSGFTLAEAIESFTMTPNGLLGITTSTSVLYVFYFVAFGAIYSAMGGGQLFTDVGLTLVGKQRGGAAKASVVSSSLMGTISGSAVANVSADGVFTIPLMKRTGYKGTEAAAIEAIASTGGQLMPPVMGVAAFVMAELLQEPYGKIALAGIIPALGFYLSIFLMVDLNARKRRISMVKEAGPPIEPIRPRLYLLIPPVLLIFLLIAGFSATYAAAWATAACIPTSFLGRISRRSPGEWLQAVTQAARQAAEVAVPIAAIGIIIEVAVQSNLALKFSTFLVELGEGNVVASLLLLILGCLVMGMGLPTVAAYMIGAILFVPVLLDLGIVELAAHFFVFYYCVLSMVTPPVALASFTAAGLAQADTMATSLKAFRYSLVAFFIPLMFVFEPSLLGQGTTLSTGVALAALIFATAGWSVALEGYFNGPLAWHQRMLAGLTSCSVWLAPMISDRLHQNYGYDLSASRIWIWLLTGAMMGAALGWCWLFRPKELTHSDD